MKQLFDKIKEGYRQVKKDYEETKRSAKQEKDERDYFITLGEKVELFPGSLEDFIGLKSEQYEIIDTGTSSKFVYYHALQELNQRHNFERIGRLGAEALIQFVNASPGWDGQPSYGIPVKRKQSEQ